MVVVARRASRLARWWARARGRGEPGRWDYLPARGRDSAVTGWAGRVVLVTGPGFRSLPPGSLGRIVDSHRQDGQTVHRIEFPTATVSAPLPHAGLELSD